MIIPIAVQSKNFKLSCTAFILIICFCHLNVAAQSPLAEIKGRATNRYTKKPIADAEIILAGTDPLLGTTTDSLGYFSLKNAPVGRYIIEASHVGFSPENQELLLSSGSGNMLFFSMSPVTKQLEEVVVSNSSYTIADRINSRKISIEQAKRFAANYQDPARILTSFPGVVPQNDQNNNIVVNGKSPQGIGWWVEGFEVVNPNHLNNAGLLTDRPTQSGGGVNVLSSQILDQTKFVGLPFSSTYGNAYSGIIDMSLNDGNKFEQDYSAQASLLGLEFATDGPIKKRKSSYNINYRYSTVGLLSNLGVDFGGEEINFQDLSFKINHLYNKGGELSIFGFGGNSKNHFYGQSNPDQWQIDKDSTQILYNSSVSAVGLKDERNISENLAFTAGGVFSVAQSTREVYGLNRTNESFFSESYSFKNSKISTKFMLDYLQKSTNIQAGAMINFYNEELKYNSSSNELTEDGVQGTLFQPFVQFTHVFNNKFQLSSGVRFMYFDYNKTQATLPNACLKYYLSSESEVSLNYARQAQRLNAEAYVNKASELEFLKTDFFSLGYLKNFKRTLLTTEIFYQQMSDVPVSIINPTFSLINEVDPLVNELLVSKGTAEFYGLNASFEKPLDKNIYYIISGSLYDAFYEGNDGIKRRTKFNGNYSFSTTAGKEWAKVKEDAVRFFGANFKVIIAGGARYADIDLEKSQNTNTTAYNFDNGYENQFNNFYRFDVRISWRKEKTKYTRVIALDIQNLFSFNNAAYSYYDSRKNEMVTQSHLGIIPVLLYRLQF
ncbi:MAG: TonB-dependent receptor [Candidatus Cyclobacteriaceae bacterium M2_1C_046]